jgi:hypothetical protein
MCAMRKPKSALERAFWLHVERLGLAMLGAARDAVARDEIAYSFPGRPSLNRLGLMEMLDAMPSWSFDPRENAFITRTAAASSTSPVPVNAAELAELRVAVAHIRPGPKWISVVGLARGQGNEIHSLLGAGSELTICQAPD